MHTLTKIILLICFSAYESALPARSDQSLAPQNTYPISLEIVDGKTAENNPDFYKQERSKKQDAERRIEFYKRNGFTVVPCQHEIPPRKSGSPWEPSFMISSHDSLPEFFIQEIKYFPYSQVYGLVENAIRKRLPDLTVDEV